MTAYFRLLCRLLSCLTMERDGGSSDEDVANEGNDAATDAGNEGVIDVEAEATPTRKRIAAAPVWQHGGEKIEGGSKCKLCGKTYKSDINNTTNLTAHILRKHKGSEEARLLKEETEEKRRKVDERQKQQEEKSKERNKFSQSKITSFAKKSSPIDPVKKKKIDQSVVEYLVLENKPFQTVEKESFRSLLHAANPSYICPSKRSVIRLFDVAAVQVQKKLKEEIKQDLDGLEVKAVHITSDHGTSSDRFKSHKNAVTLSRCTDQFEIKTDTLAVLKVEGSQTGDRIRGDIKGVLDEVGRQEDWHTNWVTDGESKQKSAREVGRHAQVGLRTTHTASCVDHTAHLAVEDSLEGRGVRGVKEATDRVRQLLNKMKDSHKMKEAFQEVMREMGEDPLALIQGTSNRWYYKFMEAERVLLLKPQVERFQAEYEAMPENLVLHQDDWHNLAIYVRSIKTLSDASTLFEGETYPTATQVIPYLDQVFADLADLAARLPQADQAYPKQLLSCLKAANRFPRGYKTTLPFNCLTLLHPSHMDIYFNDEETAQAIEDLVNDEVYDGLDDQRAASPLRDPAVQRDVAPADKFALRRAQLLASKPPTAALPGPGSKKERVKQELTKFLQGRSSVPDNTNPQLWWREHAPEFPLLARYYKSHCAFPATSTSSERVFNCEGLVVTNHRWFY